MNRPHFPRTVSILAGAFLLGTALYVSQRPAEQIPTGGIGADPRPAATASSDPVLAKQPQSAAPPAVEPPASRSNLKQVAWPIATRPGAHHVPTKADEPLPGGPPAMPLPADFLDKIVGADGKTATFTLPDGRAASGTIELIRRDGRGVQVVQGRLTAPAAGYYFFQRQTAPGVAGSMFGNVRFDQGELAYRVDPTGPNGTPMLVAHRLDQVVCVTLPPPPATAAEPPQNAPQAHPITIPIPPYQNGVVPLQSLPGATGVIYLDFDGEKGPFTGWGDFDAAPSGATNAEIKDVWQRVCEDYQGFNLNITTDRRIFDNAPETSRMHIIVTPTKNAAPTAGGVAYVGSFNSSGDTVCWGFYSTGKNAAEVISHEVGHTLGLSHDGRDVPGSAHEDYYGGQGSGETGWAPIMGVGYSENLVQWSKGEYANSSNKEDDLSIITNNNNSVDYRVDDASAAFATAPYLEVQSNNSVSNEGILETSADVDAFRFTTTGGAVSLVVSTVNASPDLDILAEICDSANTVIASSNPTAQLSATVAATLAAGDYILRVSGVGKGDPLVDGYSDYATNGAYLISGTCAGAIKPDRFTVAENTANGAAVGTVLARINHSGNPVTYSITSGNTGGAFSIDPLTGALTVANQSQLNYEALSLRWDDPATIQLFVAITDAVNPSLNETVRVVVTVSDVNEAPTIAGGSATMFEHTKIGTDVVKVVGNDVDRYEFPVFSIVGGNTGNAFAIDPTSGQITVAADITASTQATYTLAVRATDHGTPALSSNANVTINVLQVPAGYSPGTITRTFFDGINGGVVTDLTNNTKFPNNPDSEQALDSFDGGEHGDNYGSTVRGYLIPPVTGSYTFWIASDDASDLRISPNATPASATVRASVSGFTNPHEYTKYTAQKSAAITLTAGQAYYVEARHKEGGGGDHIAVAWQGPGISQQVIPGLYLAPFYQNYAPKIPATTFNVREGAYNGAVVATVPVTDVNAQDAHASYTITGGTGASVFGIKAATGEIFVTNSAALNASTTPSYTLQVRVADNGTPAMTGTGTITIKVLATGTINTTGIVQQIWTGISGNPVSALTSDPRYPNSPSTTRVLTSFDTGADYAEAYGSRIRAYVVPPATGVYTFYISGDDESQLRLSTSSNPATATQIATCATATARDTYTSLASQTSAGITLTAGQSYYIETLQKEGVGGDFVQVAWSGPTGSTPTVIPGSALKPFDANVAPSFIGAPFTFSTHESLPNGTVIGTVAAVDPDGGALTYAILAGNPSSAFAIDPSTGVLRIANTTAMPPGQAVSLTVGVQDDGGDVYPLKTNSTTVMINVVPDLTIVSPTTSNVNIPNGVGLLLAATDGGKVGASIAWSKVSGPGAVTFDSPATLSTGATFSAPGTYVVRCTEVVGGNTVPVNLTVNVGIVSTVLTGSPVGAQAIAGSHIVTGGSYQVSAAGIGIPSTATPDDFYFINQPASGNFSITARVVSLQNVGASNSRAGVMIRESLAGDAREAFCGITAINGQRFIYRAAPAVASANTAINPTQTPFQPYWVRLTRSGSSFSAQIAPDLGGTPGTFSVIGTTQTISMTSAVYVGLATASGSTTAAGSATFDNVTITPVQANIGPFVSAGVDRSVSPGASTLLDGTVTDDARPTLPGVVTTTWSKISGPGTATFVNTSAIDTSATFDTSGSYVVRLTADDGAIKTFDEAGITVSLPPIEQWRQDHFGANAGNPAIAGNSADPDGDGLKNLLEYALALDPLVPGASGIVSDTETIGTDTFLRLTVTKNPAATDLMFSVEATGDLTNSSAWTTTGTTVEVNSTSTLRVRDNTPMSSTAQRSLRLKVTGP